MSGLSILDYDDTCESSAHVAGHWQVLLPAEPSRLPDSLELQGEGGLMLMLH